MRSPRHHHEMAWYKKVFAMLARVSMAAPNTSDAFFETTTSMSPLISAAVMPLIAPIASLAEMILSNEVNIHGNKDAMTTNALARVVNKFLL